MYLIYITGQLSYLIPFYLKYAQTTYANLQVSKIIQNKSYFITKIFMLCNLSNTINGKQNCVSTGKTMTTVQT